jgi:outer membrane protein
MAKANSSHRALLPIPYSLPYNFRSSCWSSSFSVIAPSDADFPQKAGVKTSRGVLLRRQRRVFCVYVKSHNGIPEEFKIQMKRSLAIVVMLASGFVLTAAAQTLPVPAAPAGAPAPVAVPAKIAVIAFQLAVAQTNEGQRNFADLQKKYAPKEAALKSLSEEVDSLTKQLQTQSSNLSEVERASRAKVIDDKKKQLDRDTEDARNDFQQDMQDIFEGLQSKVYDVMQSYAEQQGYTLVLDVSQQQSPVLYAVNGTNITKQVIDAYNLKSGVPAPPAQPAAAAPKPAAPKPAAPKPAPSH